MNVTNLILKNFRNYESLQMKFSPGFNFILGENGVGKSNILEAITILAQLKSFRAIDDREIVRWGESSYFCSSTLANCDHEKFEVGVQATDFLKKKFKIDGLEIKRGIDYYGKFLVVAFSPVDIEIINGSPEARRRFFDSVLSKIDKTYLINLSEFKRILTSRNKLLKSMRDGKKEDFKQLDVWDHIFSEKSEILISKRVEFLSKFLYTFKHLYKCIAGDDTLNIFYSSSIDDYSKENIINVLLKTRRRDLQIGTTCIGPQRDDYVFGKTKESLFTNYCSQGQKRIASISLKMAEYDIVEKISGQKVVILVDDIFSELDENRRNHMVQLLTKGNQVIFTMANSFFGDYGNIMESKKFLVEKPGIVREL